MTDIALHHVATIKPGQRDPHHSNNKLSLVRYDSKRFYYDLSGLDITEQQFRDFIETAWNLWDAAAFLVETVSPGVYEADVI